LQSEVDISGNIMLLSHCGVDLNDPEYVCLYLSVCVFHSCHCDAAGAYREAADFCVEISVSNYIGNLLLVLVEDKYY